MLSVDLDITSLKLFKNFSSTYIEIKKLDDKVYFMTDSNDGFCFVSCNVLDGQSEEDFHFRTEMEFFSNLTNESVLKIGFNNSNEVVLNFLNKSGEFVYSFTAVKYTGACQLQNYMELLKNLDEYNKINLANVLNYIETMSKLNVNITSNGESFVSQLDTSYLVSKKFENEISKFSISATSLLKGLKINCECYFIQNYAYFTNSKVHVFLYKYKAETFDVMSWIRSKKYLCLLKINLNDSLKYIKSLKISDKDKIIVKLSSKEIEIKNDSRKIKLPMKDIKTAESKTKVDLTSLIDNLNSDEEAVRQKSIPDIVLPKYILKTMAYSNDIKLAISGTFVLLVIDFLRVVIPREDNI